MARQEAIRLREAVARYLQRRERRLAKGTVVNDRSLLTRFLGFVGGDPWFSAITPGKLEDFFTTDNIGALSPDLTEATYNAARGRMITFLAYATRQGWCPGHLMEDVPSKEQPELVMRRFSATELMHLCETTKRPQERILVQLACNTALRISDITQLRMVTADSRGKLLDVPTVDLDEGWLNVYIHKTKKVDSLPITFELDQALRAWLTHYGEIIGRPFEPGMYLVPAKRNGEWGSGPDRAFTYAPLHQISSPSSLYRRLIQEAGLPYTKGDGFHTFRRSFARLFYEELKRTQHADPIKPVQAMLHHITPEMTYRYIGVQPDREARNVVLRGELFLSRLAADTSNVTPLRRTGAQGSV